jgi:hypothetical protein
MRYTYSATPSKTPAVSVDQTVLLGVVTGYVFPVTRRPSGRSHGMLDGTLPMNTIHRVVLLMGIEPILTLLSTGF